MRVVPGQSLGLFSQHFGLLDDVLDFFLAQAPHLLQVARLDHREIIVGEVTFTNQAVGQIFSDTLDGAETGNRLFNLFLKFVLGHDFNIPAAKLARQANVLASLANCERQLILANQHDRSAHHPAEDHFIHFRRHQRVLNQHLRVFVEANDINPLATQLFNNRFDSVAPDANAGTHAIYFRVNAVDGYLAAMPRLTGNRLDRNHTFGNLRNLLLKQPLYQFRASSA